jgi:hypothetical protein
MLVRLINDTGYRTGEATVRKRARDLGSRVETKLLTLAYSRFAPVLF